jgi:hypothetical protein
MKRLILALVLGGAATLAACDDPQSYEDVETAPMVIEEPVAPSVEEQSAPVVETEAPTDATPQDNTVLPPEERASEETVEPESETLFY